ncbi:dipeptidase PepE [Flavobacterium sp.]|uniref:dipeptidase PepE n=1 Tax=Flavobacterium sp. TaxID=239 RepID=UPI0035AE50A1
MKKLIIASTSTLHGGSYLEYILPTLKLHFENCQEIIFIPYARPGGITHDEYTQKVAETFKTINISVKGLHEFDNPIEALEKAQGIFTGGGNTFLLVKQLHEKNIMDVLKKVVENGTPYLGSSAGSNITGISMQTTNDMPIVYPPSFKTLGLIPFNLNPHYLDADLQSKHMGETRETRIKEFHAFNDIPVLGLREGSWLEVTGETIILKGNLTARWFTANNEAVELETETVIG